MRHGICVIYLLMLASWSSASAAVTALNTGDEALSPPNGASLLRMAGDIDFGRAEFSVSDAFAGMRADAPSAPFSLRNLGDESSAPSGKKKYLPVLLSLLVPGAGETYMGYYGRGAVLITAEIVAWTGYFHYQDKGEQSQRDFENFADAHWDPDRWIQRNPASRDLTSDPSTLTFDENFAELDEYGRTDWGAKGEFPPYHPFAHKEEQPVNYYENIGKYDWFISGWDDWVDGEQNTDNRTIYRGMRTDANGELDTADRFIYLSLGARVFSLIETVILARGHGNEDGGQSNDSNSFRLTAHSTGPYSGEVAFVFRFR